MIVFALWAAVTLARFLVECNKLLLPVLFFQVWIVLSYALNELGVISNADRMAAIRLMMTCLAISYTCFGLSLFIPEFILWRRKRRV